MKKISVIVTVVVLSVAAIPDARAQMDALIQKALTTSPSVESKRAEYEALKAKVWSAYWPEDPELGVDAEGQPEAFDINGRTNEEWMISQTLPFPTRLILDGGIAAQEAAMAYQMLRDEERSVIRSIQSAYQTLWSSRKVLGVLNETKLIFEKMIQVSRSRYESGQGSQTDLLGFQVDLAKLSIEIKDWQERERLAQVEIASLLNEPLTTAYETPEERAASDWILDPSDLESRAVTLRPELARLRLEVKRAELESLKDKTEWLPNITLRYERRDFEAEDMSSEHDAFIGFSVPVFSLLKGIGGGWKSASEKANAVRVGADQIRNRVLFEVHRSYSEVVRAQNAIRVYEESILPQSRQMAELARASYESGKLDFVSFLDIEKDFKENQIYYFEERAAFEVNWAELKFNVGGDLK